MRRLIPALAVLLLAGCGDGAPSTVVPADATIYVGLEARKAERLLAATSRADVDFERDVRPWLGERAAYFARTPDEYGLVIDAEDGEAAEAFARKVTAAGPLRASAVIDGRLVIASSRDLLRAANAAAGSGSLADSTRLDVTGEDGDDPPEILIAAEEPRAFAAGLERYDVLPYELPLPVEALADEGPLTARVRDDLVELKGLAPVDVAPALDGVPGAASMAFASADLGADIALAADRPEDRWGIDLERAVLPHLGAGRFFVQGRGSRLLAETSEEDALRREAIALARRLGPKRADLNLERPGAEERFLRLSVGDFYLEIRGGLVRLDAGEAPGEVAEDLDDTLRYRDARRRLGGAPTLLVERPSGYVAARRDGGTLIVVEG